MPKVVLLGPSPWPIPHGLMRPTGTVLDVSDDEAQALFERGLIAVDKESEVEEETVSDGDAETGDSDTEDQEPEATDAPDEVEEEAPAPATKTGKKYPALPKKTSAPNVWKEYARVNGIDLRGLTEKQEIMGHIIKVVNG